MRFATTYQSIVSNILLLATFCSLSLAIHIPKKGTTNYAYKYEADVSGPSNFKFTSVVNLELIYADSSNINKLVRLKLNEPQLVTESSRQPFAQQPQDSEYYLYAHIESLSNRTAIIKALFSHQNDPTTFKNLKKSILINLIPTNHHRSRLSSTDQSLFIEDNNAAQPELFSPDSISQVSIVAKQRGEDLDADAAVFQSVEGHQNVTFRSRVFSEAESNLTTSFRLELVDERNSDANERIIAQAANSIDEAIKLVIDHSNQAMANYQADTIDLQRERRICSTQHCALKLGQLFQFYKTALNAESMASVEASVAFLRMMDRLRDKVGLDEIMALLKMASREEFGVHSSLLDILAAARTRDSILASLKHINLPKNKNLDIAERFLSVLSVAAKTSSKMHLNRRLQSPYYFTPLAPLKRSQAAKERQSKEASLEFIVKELFRILKHTPAHKWSSEKLRWSTLLTLATLVNANNQEDSNSIKDKQGEDISEKVSKFLLKELRNCKNSQTDCRVVALQAIGNVGHLGDDQFEALKDQVLISGRRESIVAMKVLRDLLQQQSKDQPLSQKFVVDLKNLLLRVVYDSSQETTSRVLAAEMIVRFIPNSLASEQLLNHLPSFGNSELATMIYSRMLSLRPDSLAKHHENWYWKSSIINGTSTSFVRTMAKTDSLNASYGVNVELLNKGKILKESSFDVFLDTRQRTQDLFSLGIFARGLSKIAGGSDESSGDDGEDTMAGMSLRLLGGYLRPYVFFNSYGELRSHLLWGTASEPTTAFNGDLLLIDHEEGYPLISGFVAEQQMRGVLSIDVSGKVKISIWNMNSHSLVRTKASVIVQASQSIFTSYDNLWYSNLFSFGGQAMIDFVTDSSFSSMPFKICLQVTQPEFIVRYNLRKHDQQMTDKVRRKISRRNFLIGAKSYSLNNENNKMCSSMSDEL